MQPVPRKEKDDAARNPAGRRRQHRASEDNRRGAREHYAIR